MTSVLSGKLFELVYEDLQSSRRRVHGLMKRSRGNQQQQQQQLPDLSSTEVGSLEFLVKRYINLMMGEGGGSGEMLEVVEERETMGSENEQCKCDFVNRDSDIDEKDEVMGRANCWRDRESEGCGGGGGGTKKR